MNEVPSAPTRAWRSASGMARMTSGSSILTSRWTDVTSLPQHGQITSIIVGADADRPNYCQHRCQAGRRRRPNHQEARDELGNGWARVASIHRPADYEASPRQG